MLGLSLSESLDTPLPFNTFLFLFFHSHSESFKCILGRVTRVTNSGVKTSAVSYPKTPTARSGEYEIKLLGNDFQLYYALFDRLEAKRNKQGAEIPKLNSYDADMRARSARSYAPAVLIGQSFYFCQFCFSRSSR